MKLGTPQYLRLAHLGEEPRAYVVLRPKPQEIRMPYIVPPIKAWELTALDTARRFGFELDEPTFGIKRYTFDEAVKDGLVKAEDYYDGPLPLTAASERDYKPWH